MSSTPKRFVVGISGASGAIYATRLIEALLAAPDREVIITASQAGMRVLTSELDPVADDIASADKSKSPLLPYLNLTAEQRGRIQTHPCSDIGAGPASGTFKTEATIIVPCSVNTLAAIAHGISTNLITRSAAVSLKEGRPLILVPRETPFTLIDLRNMTSATEAGAVILPANPGFYHRPKNIDEVVGYIVQKIMDRLGLDMPDAIRWSENVK